MGCGRGMSTRSLLLRGRMSVDRPVTNRARTGSQSCLVGGDILQSVLRLGPVQSLATEQLVPTALQGPAGRRFPVRGHVLLSNLEGNLLMDQVADRPIELGRVG